MKTRAENGVTKHGEPYVELKDGVNDKVILKAYANPDGTRIRIVLPELANYTQTLVDPDHHFLEFERKKKER